MISILFITWLLKANGWNVPVMIWVLEAFFLWVEVIGAIDTARTDRERCKVKKEMLERMQDHEDDGK